MSNPEGESLTSPKGIPPAEVAIDEALVRALLEEQHPELASLPLRVAESGWDNVMVRIGESMCARLPRRALGAELIEHELRWLPMLADRLPLPVPTPRLRGRASTCYPWPWSVVPWIEGRACARELPRADQARRWSEFLAALHVPAPPHAPKNAYRGVPLRELASAHEPRLERVTRAMQTVGPAARRAWQEGLALSPYAGPPLWIHGDLHPFNVLVHDGAIGGVVDWGDLTAGDRATDLASLWMILPSPEARRDAMRGLPEVDAATWARARAWAVFFGVVLADTGLAGDEDYVGPGRRILEAIVSDE